MNNTKEIQLISTDFTPKVLKRKNLFYLGAWCNNNNKIGDDKQVLKYVWFKRNTLEKDYKYLSRLFNKLIKIIPVYLNNYHKKNYPIIFWQSLIWVWLSFYLSSTFFRWKTIKEAILKNKKKKIKFVQIQFDSLICARDTHSYKNFIQESKIFNEYTFSKISNYFSRDINIIKKKKFIKYNFYKKFQYSFKAKIFSIIKKTSNFVKINFIRNKEIILQGFNIKNSVYLNLKRFTFPLFIDEIFPIKDIELKKLSIKEITKRKKSSFKFKAKNNYEKYLFDTLVTELPISFLEDFDKIKKYAKNLDIKCNLIISSVGHYFNDRYKTWLFLEKVFKKIKFIIIEHGGNHSVSRDSGFFYYDKKVGDMFVPWSKHSSLPAEKFIGHDNKNNKPINLLYAGFESDKYPSRIIPDVTTINELDNIPNLLHLTKNLNKNIFKKLVYCEKKLRDERIINSITKIIGKNKIRKKGTFVKELKNAKIVICDYPQTTYLECLITCPTLMVVNYKNSWAPLKKYNGLYYLLEKNNMLFKDIKSATKFINQNWSRIDDWWDTKKIKNIKEKILKEFNIETKVDGINKWSKFISKNI